MMSEQVKEFDYKMILDDFMTYISDNIKSPNLLEEALDHVPSSKFHFYRLF
jgi:hypothetical protein